MNKIKILAITIVVTSIVVIGVIYMNKQQPISKPTEVIKNDVDLTFAVLGDIHQNTDHLQSAINDLYSINSNMDALVLNGDTVDQGIKKQYDSVKKIISKNKDLLPKTIIKNIGNHEFFDYDTGTNSPEEIQVFINRYVEFAEEEEVYHDRWVNNYHFISLGTEDCNSETLDARTAFISEKQLKWMKERLDENYQKGKPIFLFLHQPLDYGSKDRVGVKQSEQIREILFQYPEVILFSSHTHRDLVESSVVLDQPFTIINTGAIDYTLIPDENSENGRKSEPYIKGVYIEVSGNNLVIKGRDIKEKQWIFTRQIYN